MTLRCTECNGIRGALIGGCRCLPRPEHSASQWFFRHIYVTVDPGKGKDESVTVNSHGTRVAPDGSISEADLLKELGHVDP